MTQTYFKFFKDFNAITNEVRFEKWHCVKSHHAEISELLAVEDEQTVYEVLRKYRHEEHFHKIQHPTRWKADQARPVQVHKVPKLHADSKLNHYITQIRTCENYECGNHYQFFNLMVCTIKTSKIARNWHNRKTHRPSSQSVGKKARAQWRHTVAGSEEDTEQDNRRQQDIKEDCDCWLIDWLLNVTSTQKGQLVPTAGLVSWLFNGTSTQKGQFVPTTGGRIPAHLRMANGIQCIIPHVTR